MFREFEDQLRAVGVNAAGITQIDEWMRAKDYHVTWNWQAAEKRQKEADAARKAERDAAALAAAVPYTGQPMFCEARVYGERVTSWRCNRQAKFMVQHDRIQKMVCKQHVRTETR